MRDTAAATPARVPEESATAGFCATLHGFWVVGGTANSILRYTLNSKLAMVKGFPSNKIGSEQSKAFDNTVLNKSLGTRQHQDHRHTLVGN